MSITVNTSALLSSGGFDVQSLADAMIQADQAPEQTWQTQLQTAQSQASALQALSTDLSNLSDDANSLNDYTGAFSSRSVTSSNSSVVTASATTGAAIGEHSVTVTNLASKASYYSNTQVATGDTALTTGGTLSIKVGNGTTQTIDLSQYNTLNKIAAQINKLSIGATASVINDSSGSVLSLVGNNTGTANDVTLSTTTGAALSFTQTSSGKDANFSIDGIPLTSATNTVTGIISGVSFQLAGQSSSAVDVSVSADTGATSQAIGSFVSDYNTLISALNSQFTFDTSRNSAGPLADDSVVQQLQQQLLQAISGSTSSSGSITGLSSLGITMNDDGTLSLDSSILNNALSSNFSDVQNFLQNTGNGFASNLSDLLTSLTDPTNGPISVDLKGINATETSLNDSINNMNANMAILRQQLVDQLTQASNALQELPLEEEQIAADLGQLPTVSSSSSSGSSSGS
ncbi:MAG TPA: flagellar filament capping protein FliD [Terriglobales bacterium]|nr:flagellar filament capping protein FliD [Terriglobales bacterium]